MEARNYLVTEASMELDSLSYSWLGSQRVGNDKTDTDWVGGDVVDSQAWGRAKVGKIRWLVRSQLLFYHPVAHSARSRCPTAP